MSSDHFLAQAQELVAMGTYLLDRTTGIIHISAETARLLRAGDRAFDMLLDECRARFYFPGDRSEATQRAEQNYAVAGSRIMEARVVRGDGSLIWARASSRAQLDGRGAPIVVGVFQDITEQKLAEQRLRDREQGLQELTESLRAKNWALSAYALAADTLRTSMSESQLVQGFCDSITRDRNYVLAGIGLIDERTAAFRMAATSSPGQGVDHIPPCWTKTEPSGQGPLGRCLRSRRTERLDETETDAQLAPLIERARAQGILSCIAVPMLLGDKVLGALIICAGTRTAFGDEEVTVFERLAGQVAHGLQSLRNRQHLQTQIAEREVAQQHLAAALEATISAMSSTMEQRDPYTAGHERRVAEIAVAIGEELGWSADRLHGLRMAALVHDIGKISVPSEILTKPTRLTPPEFEIIQQHPETGYTILKDIPFPWPVARMVYEHHERLDGSGYPQRLRGDQMLPESRILAIADMLEAMASDRPYRPARGAAFALQQIASEAGTTLDAEGVAACLKLYRDQGRTLPG